jgi:signal transduction histidine kinase
LKILQIGASSTNQIPPVAGMTPADLSSNVVSRPTQLSEPILEAVAQIPLTTSEKSAVEGWRKQWEIDEATRQLYAAMRAHLDAARIDAPFWFEVNESSPSAPNFAGGWFAFPAESALARSAGNRLTGNRPAALTPLPSAGERETLQTTGVVNRKLMAERTGLSSLAEQTNVLFYAYGEHELWLRQVDNLKPANLPPYLGVGIQIAGKSITPNSFLHLWREVSYLASKGGGVKKEVLAELATDLLASAAQTVAGTEFVRVNVYLTSPTDLFKRQRTRTFWLGSVIGTSFLAALAGLLAAWRSFSRQQQLTEMKANFVSSVSHELRAPIASVRLLAESLERGNISTADKQNQYYHFIGQECRRLSSLIENVLDFSRIEQGRKQYELEPTDVVALVRQTVTLMNPYAQEREVSLVLELANSLPEHLEMSLDGQAIQQALINLIDNALKHSAKGWTIKVGLEIESKAAADANGGATSVIHLFVEDQGPGIPEAEHQKIFERFYRLGSELRRETQGIGIGLSIVKHIVEAHDGKVIVHSSPGSGSRFTLELPLTQAKAS